MKFSISTAAAIGFCFAIGALAPGVFQQWVAAIAGALLSLRGIGIAIGAAVAWKLYQLRPSGLKVPEVPLTAGKALELVKWHCISGSLIMVLVIFMVNDRGKANKRRGCGGTHPQQP